MISNNLKIIYIFEDYIIFSFRLSYNSQFVSNFQRLNLTFELCDIWPLATFGLGFSGPALCSCVYDRS